MKHDLQEPAAGDRSVFPHLLGQIVLLSVLFAILCLTIARDVRTHQAQDRGIVWGIPRRIPLAAVPPLGVNVALERYPDDRSLDDALQAVDRAGLRWVRQSFRWADMEPEPGQYRWTQADRWVQAIHRHHLRLIAVLDTAPRWARTPEDAGERRAPPAHYEDFGRFAASFARRYGTDVAAYQIWDEPNIAPHWGNRYVDPVAYTFLLRTAAREIRAVRPAAVILTAALAPTTEAAGANMNEILFLRQMYGVGAARYFDVLAAEPYGFRTGPEDRRVALSRLNFSRVLALREEMEDWGDGDKAIWVTAFGWNALPADWTGRPSIWGTTTPDEQARRTWQAISRAQAEWPWMGAMLLPTLQPDAPPDDPLWGFALLSPRGEPTPLYDRLVQEAQSSTFTGVGWYPAYTPLPYTPLPVESPALAFRGTRLDAVVRGPLQAHVQVQGEDVTRTVVVTGLGIQRVTLLQGLRDGPHRASLTVTEAGTQATLEALVVAQERPDRFHTLKLLLLILAACLLLWPLVRLCRQLPAPLRWQRFVLAALQRGRFPVVLFAMGIVLLIFYVAASWPVILGALALSFCLYVLWPNAGLTLTVFSIPFFLLPKVFPGGKQFSVVELMTWAGAGVWIVRQILPPAWWHPRQARENRANGTDVRPPLGSRSWNGLDLSMLAFALLGLASLSWATNFGTAARQFRVVVLDPVLFYGLVRAYTPEREDVLHLLDALVLAGVALALHALLQTVTGIGAISAEGVLRARSVYGSPNNLALFLGRVLPIAAATGVFGRDPQRRRWIVLACFPLSLAMFLTFSRGAWLLGLPAAMLFLAWHGGRRIRFAFAVAAAAGLAALIPFAGTERLASLFSLRSGTSFVRLNLWTSTVQMIRDHPWRGIGLDNFLYLYPRYLRPAAWGEPALSHPHNVLLHFWVALGIVGLGIFLWQQGLFWHEMRLRLGAVRASGQGRAISLGLMASMVYFLAHGMIDHSYFLVDLAYVYMLTMASRGR